MKGAQTASSRKNLFRIIKGICNRDLFQASHKGDSLLRKNSSQVQASAPPRFFSNRQDSPPPPPLFLYLYCVVYSFLPRNRPAILYRDVKLSFFLKRFISQHGSSAMGAAASVKHVYAQALGWFKSYIDHETYLKDFDALDKDHDGGVTFGELERWVSAKTLEDPAWGVFKGSKQVLSIAHKNAALYQDSKSSGHAGKVVDVGEFKALLIHMFAVSILWRHFDSADHWEAAGDVGNQQLTLEEFSLACKTLCAAHEHEFLSDETILNDFEMLDTNQSNSIGFMEVCNYCCQFIDMGFGNGAELLQKAELLKSEKAERLLGAHRNSIILEEKWDANSKAKNISSDEKTAAAVEALQHKITDEEAVMEAVRKDLEEHPHSDAAAAVPEGEAVEPQLQPEPQQEPVTA